MILVLQIAAGMVLGLLLWTYPKRFLLWAARLVAVAVAVGLVGLAVWGLSHLTLEAVAVYGFGALVWGFLIWSGAKRRAVRPTKSLRDVQYDHAGVAINSIEEP